MEIIIELLLIFLMCFVAALNLDLYLDNGSLLCLTAGLFCLIGSTKLTVQMVK